MSIYICTYRYTCIHIDIHTCIYTYTYIYIIFAYIYIHIYTYIYVTPSSSNRRKHLEWNAAWILVGV